MNGRNKSKKCIKRRIIRRLYMSKQMHQQNRHSATKIQNHILNNDLEAVDHELKRLHEDEDKTVRFLDDTIKLIEEQGVES
ncbi:MAG: hypothetical protein B655_1595 [Methanobacterium sp. Maddingley MBC34]|nr:MAG: hypothetical protein B655_1595 [Methanobacterium sp. Maddingley MBC34]